MIRKIRISVVIALIILVNGLTQAIAFSMASNPEKLGALDEGCGNLVVGSKPNEDGISRLEIQDSSTTAAIAIFLRQENSSAQDLEDIHLTAVLYDKEDDTLEAGVSSSFKSNGDDVEPDGITLPKSGSPVLIDMTLDNLPESEDFTIRLYADCGNGVEPLLEAPLTRKAEAVLIIEESNDGAIGPIIRTVQAFAYTIRIVPENQTKIEDLQIIVEPFTDTIGDQYKVEATVGDKPITGTLSVPPGGIALNVTAKLPHVDTYESRIILNYDGEEESTKLTVDRQPSTTIVTAEVRPTSSVISRWPFNSDDSEGNSPIEPIEIVLESASTRPATIDSKNVTIRRLDRLKDGDQKDPIVSPDLMPMDSNQPGQSHVVSSGNSLTLKYVITGLKGAGTYAGALEVGVADAQPLDLVPFTLQLKERKEFAVIAIIFGIFLSWFFRDLVGKVKPSYEREKLADEYLTRLGKIRKEKIPSEFKPTMEVLFERIQRDLEDIRGDSSNQDADSKLDTAKKKLYLVDRIVDTINVIEKIPADKRGACRSKLIDYVNRIISDQIISEEEFSNLKNELISLDTEALAQIPRRRFKAHEREKLTNIGIGALVDKIKRARKIDPRGAIKPVAYILALIFALLIGINNLWEPNDTWGSRSQDFIAAIIWGFSLSQGSEKFLADLIKINQNTSGSSD